MKICSNHPIFYRYQNADWRIRPLPREMIKYVFYRTSIYYWFPFKRKKEKKKLVNVIILTFLKQNSGSVYLSCHGLGGVFGGFVWGKGSGMK